ncbi:MAG: DUF1475 family protein [Pseudomonadales bacterium]|jgi:hypothetical protein|nr:DUF1475 family protein [Pseudomonadales bacterium]
MKIAVGIAAAAFVAYLGLALATEDTAEFFALLADPWMKVVLADFYLGVFLFAVIVWAVEDSVLAALLWGVATACLGNPVAAVWLVLRGLSRLRDKDATAGD